MTSDEMTQQQFAALRGVSEPMVSRWKAKGRLAMTADGKRVRVAESIALLERTLDPARGGNRSMPRAASAADLAAPSPAADQQRGGGRYHDAAADEKTERAAILRLERMQLEGALVFRDKVEREAQSRATECRDALFGMADRLAPLLAAESDATRCRALLETEIRHIAALLATRITLPQDPA